MKAKNSFLPFFVLFIADSQFTFSSTSDSKYAKTSAICFSVVKLVGSVNIFPFRLIVSEMQMSPPIS